MQKLITCARKCGPSRPNLVAVSLPVAARSLPIFAKKTDCCISVKITRRGADQTPRLKCLWTLFHHEQRVEDDGFSQRHTEHRQRDYFAERAGIASHRLGSFHADEPHADSRTESAQADVNTPAHLRQHWRYHNFPFVMWWLLFNGSGGC